MDVKEIERLVETYILADLKNAERALVQGEELAIEVAGDSPGEKLGYITAASWIVEKIKEMSWDFQTAFEAYSKMVRQL